MDNAPRYETARLRVPVGDVGGEDGGGEEEEGENGFPELDDLGRRDGDDDVEPEVGEDAPRRRDEENAQVLDPTDLHAPRPPTC